MERLTTDIMAEMAIKEMISIDMQQLSRMYHRLRLYEVTGITPDEFAIIDQEYTKMARELSMLRGQRTPAKSTKGQSLCPECGQYIKRCYSFCPGCGKEIDWSSSFLLEEMIINVKYNNNRLPDGNRV